MTNYNQFFGVSGNTFSHNELSYTVKSTLLIDKGNKSFSPFQLHTKLLFKK